MDILESSQNLHIQNNRTWGIDKTSAHVLCFINQFILKTDFSIRVEVSVLTSKASKICKVFHVLYFIVFTVDITTSSAHKSRYISLDYPAIYSSPKFWMKVSTPSPIAPQFLNDDIVRFFFSFRI